PAGRQRPLACRPWDRASACRGQPARSDAATAVGGETYGLAGAGRSRSSATRRLRSRAAWASRPSHNGKRAGVSQVGAVPSRLRWLQQRLGLLAESAPEARVLRARLFCGLDLMDGAGQPGPGVRGVAEALVGHRQVELRLDRAALPVLGDGLSQPRD